MRRGLWLSWCPPVLLTYYHARDAKLFSEEWGFDLLKCV
jgi:hypothetical protein